MSSKDLRIKYLTSLASETGEQAELALKKAAQNIARKIKTETRYDLIEEQLEFLHPISYRVPEETMGTMKDFLSRLETLDLLHQDSQRKTEEWMKSFYTKEKLQKKALDILAEIRYIKAIDVFEIFLNMAISDQEDVRKHALEGIEQIANYRIEVIRQIGITQQTEIFKKISTFDANEKTKYFNPIATVCHALLSPTMEGTYWKGPTVTISSGAVPLEDALKDLRKKVIIYLGELFFIVSSPKKQGRILGVLQEATRPPRSGRYNDDFAQMVIDDTIQVLSLLEKFVKIAPLEIVQSIEHDAYWAVRRRKKDEVTTAALRIRDAIEANEEYQIFKYLIGFEGVFDDWEDNDDSTEKFSRIDKLRESKAKEFADSISDQNYDTWRTRILSYAKVESDDLATFPVFGKFLNFFGKASPALALKLLMTDAAALERFLTALIVGVWTTSEQPRMKKLLINWIEQRLFLPQISRAFEFTSDIDSEVLKNIFSNAVQSNDASAIIQVALTAAAHIDSDNRSYVETFFMPAIEALTAQQDSRWIFGLWFQDRSKKLLKNLSYDQKKEIVKNLVFLKEIDYQAEEILAPIAEDHPELIIDLFAKRLDREKELNRDTYRAIPFDLHKINVPLLKHTEIVFNGIIKWLETDTLFQYRGGRLLAEIFNGAWSSLNAVVLRIASEGDLGKIDAIIDVLRNLHGEVELHPAFQAIVKALPEDDKDRLNELMIALESTGVVGGSHGFVEAWKTKQDELRPWLAHEDVKVRNFAQKYISDLDSMIEAERARADERVKHQNYQWGSNEDGE